MDWLYWSVTTVMGAGDASQVKTPIGYAISWLLILFGVAIVASLTGALVGFLIDYLLKEGQGMGASGYRDHIIVCGWNSTARELIQELSTDEYTTKIVVIHDSDKNPAGEGVYFVSGDITTAHDLKRAGVEDAQAAVVCPADGSNEADMKSILCVMAIESIAPQVRTVVEVNNPSHVEHFQRADADEILVSSQLVSRLMARSSLYPGLAGLVTDIVSGGEGSELYRVQLPDDYVGLVGRRALRQAPRRAPRHAALGQPLGPVLRQPARGLPARTGRRPGRGRGVARHAGPAADGPRPRQPVGPRLSPAAPPRSRRRRRPSTSPPASRRRRRTVPTTRATTSSSGPALTIVSGPSSWQPTASMPGTSGRRCPCPAPGRWSAGDSWPLPTSNSTLDAGAAGEDRRGEPPTKTGSAQPS